MSLRRRVITVLVLVVTFALAMAPMTDTATAAPGYLSDAEGISVVNGQLESEAINGKAAMLLPGGTPRIGRVRTYLFARSSDGSESIVDGRDRPNGKVFGCGGVGGDQPTQFPLATYPCTDSSEIIQFLPSLGPSTPAGNGFEVVLVVVR